MSTSGHLECCGCRLGDQWTFGSTEEMIDHLAEHRKAGHRMPDDIEEALREDDYDDFVAPPRCQVVDCDKTITCGSPSPNGYVQACSIEHGQELGGFADWVPANGY